MNLKKLISTTALLSIIGMTTSCAVNPVSGKKNFVMMSESQEISLGASQHKQVLKRYKPYNNAALQAYVKNIGQQLAKHSHRSNIAYKFTVVDDPSINAFALPGGYIYITTGLMAYLNSEAQLAGVLGHEIGHVTARHGVRQQSRNMATNILASVLINKVGNAQAIQQISTAVTRGYGRKHELESDRLGAEYLARVGYRPENMIKVVEVLKAQEDFGTFLARSEGKQPPSYHGTFSTHPSNDKRLHEVVTASRRFSTAGTRPDNERSYLNRIQGLKYRIGKKKYGRLKMITVRSGMTFASLAKNSVIPKYAEEKLRLLNGMFPKGEPRAGQLIKIVE